MGIGIQAGLGLMGLVPQFSRRLDLALMIAVAVVFAGALIALVFIERSRGRQINRWREKCRQMEEHKLHRLEGFTSPDEERDQASVPSAPR